MNHWDWLRLALLALIASLPPAWAAELAPADRGAEMFTNPIIHRIEITIPPEGLTSLQTNARQYVVATMREGTNAFPKVGLHLKGSTGSFRGLDGKPGFTISVDKFEPGLRFHGLHKLHLNNSVEDASYMNELIGGEMFRAAGVPAARVAHALVELNGRRLGLYVLKEGFTEDFLSLYFRHPGGDLYDTGAGHDVDEALRKDLGKNPEDRANLDALTAAAEEPDLARRWDRLQHTLDIDRFLNFMALEILLGHRDGYCLARNNFRVYQDLDTGRIVFFPHGMDTLFGNARTAIEPNMSGLVARALMETPGGRRAYRSHFALVFTNYFDPVRLAARVDGALPVLRATLPANESAVLDREAVALKERMAARALEVKRQLQQSPMELLHFTDGVAALRDWQPYDVPEGGSLSTAPSPDGKPALTIRAGPATAASWRTQVLLPPGRYHFEALIRTEGVSPLAFGKNQGATLRVGSERTNRPPGLVGDNPWKVEQAPFTTTAPEEKAELICELRASRGTAWFQLDSLKLVREK